MVVFRLLSESDQTSLKKNKITPTDVVFPPNVLFLFVTEILFKGFKGYVHPKRKNQSLSAPHADSM